MNHTLSRRKLYDLVWARPMIKVAAEFGISDVGLNKICKRHRVPVPGRGYWAKLASGKKVAKAPFRELADEGLNRVTIQKSLTANVPPEAVEARIQAKSTIAARHPPKVDARLSAASQDRDEIHPLVRPTRDKINSSKGGANNLIGVSGAKYFAVTCTAAAVEQAANLLSQLVIQAETLGYQFEKSDKGLLLVADGESMTVELSEQQDRIPHVMTEKETVALAKWTAEYERRKKQNQWASDWDKPRIPDRDYIPNGRFALELDKGYHSDGIRRRFADGKRQRLDRLIGDVLGSAAAISAQRKVRQEEHRLQRLRWEEAERRRKEADRVHRLETKRWECLEVHMTLLEKAQRVECFVEAYRKNEMEQELPHDCAKFILWAEEQSDLLRKEISPEKISYKLDRYKLMDDATDIASWIKIE